jgi:Holliday junction resolvase RusA-like endonuclease
MRSESKTAEVSFTVPGRPRAKARPWASSANGRAHVYTPKGTATYEATVRVAAHAALGDRPRIDGPVKIAICVRLEPPRSTGKAARSRMLAGEQTPTKRPDLDNIVKGVLDGCNGIVFQDDCDIIKLEAEKMYHITEGVDVIVTPLCDNRL